jgi:uncharacterized membrane protein (GlpM family)
MLALPLLLLALKMAIAATIVVSASVVAERARPFIAAMIATLPVSAGPALVFLALDHDTAFLSATLTGAMVTNIATAAYCLAYVVAAQRWGTPLALASALVAWATLALILRQIDWNLTGAFIGTAISFGLAMPLSRRFLSNERPVATPRPWYAIPMRALAVASLVALVTTLSWTLGPHLSGMLAVFPIVLSSIIVILQPRIGGRQTAALIASSLVGLIGFGMALGIAALSIPVFGKFWALGIGLGICMAWNGALVLGRNWRRARRARA